MNRGRPGNINRSLLRRVPDGRRLPPAEARRCPFRSWPSPQSGESIRRAVIAGQVGCGCALMGGASDDVRPQLRSRRSLGAAAGSGLAADRGWRIDPDRSPALGRHDTCTTSCPRASDSSSCKRVRSRSAVGLRGFREACSARSARFDQGLGFAHRQSARGDDSPSWICSTTSEAAVPGVPHLESALHSSCCTGWPRFSSGRRLVVALRERRFACAACSCVKEF